MRAPCLVLMIAAGCSMGRGWTRANTALELSYIAASAVDWRQTNEGLAVAGYDENPAVMALGGPGVYFPITMLAHAAIAAALPPRWREAFQVASTGIELETDRENMATLQLWQDRAPKTSTTRQLASRPR